MSTAIDQRDSDYITNTRNAARKLWEAISDLRSNQQQWNALDYTNTLSPGVGANDGITKVEIGSVVFDTTEALLTLLENGHATNLAKLL